VPQVFAAGVAVELAVWACAWRDWIGNWPFAIFTILWVMFLPRVAMAVRPAAFGIAPVGDDVPLELVGIDRPFRPDDLVTMDTAIGLRSAASR
jgi:hypothetical protein